MVSCRERMNFMRFHMKSPTCPSNAEKRGTSTVEGRNDVLLSTFHTQENKKISHRKCM